MIIIDGSFGEGGGSILRQSLCLSLITKKPFRIINIRKNRKKSGLAKQHLASISCVLKLTTSKVFGNHLGSLELEFYPGDFKNKKVSIDVKSAGSLTLLSQSFFLASFLSGKNIGVNLIGGTDVPFSMTPEYYNEVYLSLFKNHGKVLLETKKRGYNPKGNGVINFSLKGRNFFNKLDLVSRGKLLRIKIFINSSLEFDETKLRLHLSSFTEPIQFVKELNQNVENEVSITGILEYENFKVGCCIRQSEIKEDITDFIYTKLFDLHKSEGVDDNLADNIVPILSLVPGSVLINNFTNHIKSNIYLSNMFSDKKIEYKNKIISS